MNKRNVNEKSSMENSCRRDGRQLRGSAIIHENSFQITVRSVKKKIYLN
jgi:hypothetical protein